MTYLNASDSSFLKVNGLFHKNVLFLYNVSVKAAHLFIYTFLKFLVVCRLVAFQIQTVPGNCYTKVVNYLDYEEFHVIISLVSRLVWLIVQAVIPANSLTYNP